MDILIFAVWLATYLAGAVWYILYLIHMFQQNSYKPREYREWMGLHVNVGRLLGKSLYAVISLPLVLVGNMGCLVAACVMNGMTAWVNKPRRAKKPLVYTPRVKRMLVTTGILYLLVMAVVLLPGIWMIASGGMVVTLRSAAVSGFAHELHQPSDRAGD